MEKKKKDINLTQEQINKMVHDSCVLFCKHCGCGIPRDTCTSLGTCKEHDEYRDAIRAHLMKKKERFNPNTLQPFDKVLVRDFLSDNWMADFFEKIDESNVNYNVACVTSHWIQCIPYNEETKHLLGTTEECTEYYKWWED